MASRILFSPFTHRVGLIAGLGLGSAALFPSLLSPYHKSRLLYCDSSVGPKDWSLSQYQHDARTPIVKNGKLNSGAIKQLSSGSICGKLWERCPKPFACHDDAAREQCMLTRCIRTHWRSRSVCFLETLGVTTGSLDIRCTGKDYPQSRELLLLHVIVSMSCDLNHMTITGDLLMTTSRGVSHFTDIAAYRRSSLGAFISSHMASFNNTSLV